MKEQICLNCGHKYSYQCNAICLKCNKDLGSLRVEAIVCYQICQRKECVDCPFFDFLVELEKARGGEGERRG